MPSLVQVLALDELLQFVHVAAVRQGVVSVVIREVLRVESDVSLVAERSHVVLVEDRHRDALDFELEVAAERGKRRNVTPCFEKIGKRINLLDSSAFRANKDVVGQISISGHLYYKRVKR